jgi:hypothetical protein
MSALLIATGGGTVLGMDPVSVSLSPPSGAVPLTRAAADPETARVYLHTSRTWSRTALRAWSWR